MRFAAPIGWRSGPGIKSRVGKQIKLKKAVALKLN